LANNLTLQNSAFYIGGALTVQYQQNVGLLYNTFTATLVPSQPQADAPAGHGIGLSITEGMGADTSASNWEIGVCGDAGPTNHASGDTLNPDWSVLKNITGYAATNSSADPKLASQYCNASRTPLEIGASGWAVLPGISDATFPNPILNFIPVANVNLSSPSLSLVTGAMLPHNWRITLTNNTSSASPGRLTRTATATVTDAGLAGIGFTVTGGTCVSGLAVAIFLSGFET
jgi:hypothetical protein